MPINECVLSKKNMGSTKVEIIKLPFETSIFKKNIIKNNVFVTKAQIELIIKKSVNYKKKALIKKSFTSQQKLDMQTKKEVSVQDVMGITVRSQPYYMRGKFFNTGEYFYWNASINDSNAIESGYDKSVFSEIVLNSIIR